MPTIDPFGGVLTSISRATQRTRSRIDLTLVGGKEKSMLMTTMMIWAKLLLEKPLLFTVRFWRALSPLCVLVCFAHPSSSSIMHAQKERLCVLCMLSTIPASTCPIRIKYARQKSKWRERERGNYFLLPLSPPST